MGHNGTNVLMLINHSACVVLSKRGATMSSGLHHASDMMSNIKGVLWQQTLNKFMLATLR